MDDEKKQQPEPEAEPEAESEIVSSSFKEEVEEDEDFKELEEEYRKEGVAVGYRFEPTDCEAFKHYLHPKVHLQPILARFIHEVDVYKYHPADLPGFKKGRRKGEKTYYFTPREQMYSHGKRANRSANQGKGCWKITSKFTPIKEEVDGSILGKKNTLVYWIKNTEGKLIKTKFIMHEYVLDELQTDPTKSDKSNNVVLCSIYERQSAAEQKREKQAKEESQQNPSEHCSESSQRVVPTTGHFNSNINKDDKKPALKMMVKGKRSLGNRSQEEEEEYNPQSKRFRPYCNAYESIGESSQRPRRHVFQLEQLQCSLQEEFNRLKMNSQRPSQVVLQPDHQLQCSQSRLRQQQQQQPVVIENTIHELPSSIMMPPCTIKSQNTSLGINNAGSCTTDKPQMSSLRKENCGHETPLNRPLPSIPSTTSEFVQPPICAIGLAPAPLEEGEAADNDVLYFQDLNFYLDGDPTLPW